MKLGENRRVRNRNRCRENVSDALVSAVGTDSGIGGERDGACASDIDAGLDQLNKGLQREKLQLLDKSEAGGGDVPAGWRFRRKDRLHKDRTTRRWEPDRCRSR